MNIKTLIFSMFLSLLTLTPGFAARHKAKAKHTTKTSQTSRSTATRGSKSSKVSKVTKQSSTQQASPSVFNPSVLWPKIADAGKISSSKRKKFVEQFYGILAKGGISSQDEAVVLAGLSVLHCNSDETRYAAPGILSEAKAKWPGMIGIKETAILWDAFVKCYSEKTPLDDIALREIARTVDGFLPSPQSSTAFAFYRAEALFEENRQKDSMKYLAEISIDSENYRRSKYLEALVDVNQGKLSDARDAYQVVISLEPTRAERRSNLSSGTIQRLRELAVLNLARLLYEQGQFLESVAYYRTLAQDSYFFYDSLYEQGWAFFMAGYPNRALGAEYAATTPFFENIFNPDAYFLTAAVHYWMCNFEDSQRGIQRFIQHTRDEGDELRGLVARFATMPQNEALLRYAGLLVDEARGVSASNLGLGNKVLYTLRNKDYLQESLNALLSLEQQRVSAQKKLDIATAKDRLIGAMNRFEDVVRRSLGRQVRNELTVMAQDFEKSLTQSRLLYLEILTARKDALLGKERTVSGGEFVGSEHEFYESAMAQAHAWKQDKNEFWYDELGHYVFDERSQCGVNTSAKSERRGITGR